MLTFPADPIVNDEYQEAGNSWTWNAKSVWERGVGPEPVLTSLVPDSAYVTFDQNKPVEINGSGFQLNSVVYFDGIAKLSNYVSPTKMMMTVNGVNELTPRDAPVRVDRSNELPFHFLPRPPDSPRLDRVQPGSAWTIWPTTPCECIGSGFEANSVVVWTAPFTGAETVRSDVVVVSPTSITFTIEPSQMATGDWKVHVRTAGADVPDSNQITFNVSA